VTTYGLKIKNISAGMIYDVNLGIRDYFTYTDAMFSNSLFNFFLQRNGLSVHKKESTRDIICLDYDFGSRDYDAEHKRLTRFLSQVQDEDTKKRVLNTLQNIEQKKELYSPLKREAIRTAFYEHGVDITYKKFDKELNKWINDVTIHYEMLFRTNAKAKLGQVMFINSKLYKKAYDWLTIGLGDKMDKDNAKIVEMSAYAPLTTSTIIDSIHIPVEDILILKDQDSFFTAIANVVMADKNKHCIVTQKETQIKSTLWDGMALVENNILPEFINTTILLRNHLFKACGFRSNLQLFFRDYCRSHNLDYNTYQIHDMFGKLHFVKDIKMITTDNAIKWKKFMNLMGDNPYEYWCDRIHADGDIWGIVKTDHISKLGNNQQLSYQMVNTLPCTEEEMRYIASDSVTYIEKLKTDNNEFEKFLRKNNNEINNYEMLADLYKQNHEFSNCSFFRREKTDIIKQYVKRMRKGKIFINGDNLTICGNPYELLLYAMGDKGEIFKQRHDSIECYTPRFDNEIFLAGFRSPHNSPNNCCYLFNIDKQRSDRLTKYICLSRNTIAVNGIHTDIQARLNGCDYDSDFILATDNPVIVLNAKRCFLEYKTIVNDLKESGITYKNLKSDYAEMDNKFSKSRMGIGYSSNLAQLAITYYWTELAKEHPNQQILKELYNNFVILSVLAQVVIDSCKREYEIDALQEIARISRLPSMVCTKDFITATGDILTLKKDFPTFMKYTREIKYTKDGKEIPFEQVQRSKNKIKQRINSDLTCPMNWLEECLDDIKNNSTSISIPINEFFIKLVGKPNNRQMQKFITIINKYDNYIKHNRALSLDNLEEYLKVTEDFISQLNKIKITNVVTINRLIETAFGIDTGVGASKLTKGKNVKYTRKILNMLYKTNKTKFLDQFKKLPN